MFSNDVTHSFTRLVSILFGLFVLYLWLCFACNKQGLSGGTRGTRGTYPNTKGLSVPQRGGHWGTIQFLPIFLHK